MTSTAPVGGPGFELARAWDAAVRTLSREVRPALFTRYVEALHIVEDLQAGALLLRLPTDDAADWVSLNLLPRIKQLMCHVINGNRIFVEVSNQPDMFLMEPAEQPQPQQSLIDGLRPAPALLSALPANTVAAEAAEGFAPPQQLAASMQRQSLRRRTGLAEKYTFDNFFAGASNEVAYLAAQTLACEDDSAEENCPLFISGPVGLGKTHLAHAIGNTFLDRRPGANVRLLSGEQFMREVQESFMGGQIKNFRTRFRKHELLIIDDIQTVGRDSEQTYRQFLALLNYFNDNNLPIVITCDRPAQALNSRLPNRIVSRLAGGLEVIVGAPDLETRIGILHCKARSLMGIRLPDSVARHVASHLRSNCRELVGALKRINIQARYANQPIDLEIAKQVLGEITLVPSSFTVAQITEKVALYYGLRTADLVSKRRGSELVRARHVAMHLARELTSASLPDIGAAFNRHHTSVLHACVKIGKELHASKSLQAQIDQLHHKLNS